ncbi:MAG TPA: MarR family transcriptional regulator [Gemmatimonadales bacterium]|nr:MarR family transcriptional regulator [Gemmatimonadales bacterium]
MINRATVPASAVNYTALAEFRFEIRRFLHMSEEAARKAGLEPQQHQLLLALKGARPGIAPTIRWLSERLQVQHHSAVGLVDRLVERGMVRRYRDPSDLRRALISLTGGGESVLAELSKAHMEELKTRAKPLISAMATIVRGAA